MSEAGPPFEVDDWQAAAAAKRRELHDRIPRSHLLPPKLSKEAAKRQPRPLDSAVVSRGILSTVDIEITEIEDVAVLVECLRDRKYPSVQVLNAFAKRASIAQQCCNCLTEVFYSSALTRAQELDDHLAKTGQPDCFGIKGLPVTAGLVSWIPNVAEADSSITKGLIAAGAVLYIKTNVSQAHLMVESIHNVFGTTCNSYNPALSAGGSNGGEGAVVAAKGAILGSGTDGGGSLRFPAMFNDLWSLKCSKGRMPRLASSRPEMATSP